MSAVNIAEELNVAVPQRADATTTHATQPFLWSIRRELWENTSILGAPIAVAALLIIAVLVSFLRNTNAFVFQVSYDNAAAVSSVGVLPLIPIPALLGITMLLVAIFYSLDGMLSERRDRSILFWKSLPVSDTTTVLSKMAVPMVILPIVTFVLSIATQIVVFIIEIFALLAHHASASAAWTGLPLFPLLGLMIYTLVVVTLWYAPIYAWLLLVSSWARRMPLVWAVMPFILLSIFERIAYHTHHVRDFISNRFAGVFFVAFSKNPQRYQSLGIDWTPAHLLATPAFWGGLLFAALALILIIRLRRFSEPL